MATLCRIDPHAHLYDSFSARAWCEAAARNLGGSPSLPAFVVVVDRDGQDSLSRLRAEVPSFGTWSDVWGGAAGRISLGASDLTVIQGTQYVTSERIEVLALGVKRAAPDRMMASEYVSLINEQGGLACLPWSPGKWLGARGEVVRRVLDTTPSTVVTVGDISIRSRLGPPSSLLRYARQKGFAVLSGTDPLPRLRDERLVGSFGLELSLADGAPSTWEDLKNALISPSCQHAWGHRNSLPLAVARFLSSVA